ncbi:copper amine oxidase N-terminal domain-containing protein [Paenibacillus durus]|uniref:copper amine oxidase N-terminal domain-containing protein n=1 Tax=Paenibacillus durus TaxID=44251 RepID=UPI00047160F4|nr:copper amine oxidase N-terminal domain-containing protein [Paenibacillus durus]
MKIRNTFLLIVFITSLLTINNPVHAESYTRDISYEQQILLNINGFYLLYTTPQAPYIDDDNRTMVPLRSFTKLLGAKATYDALNKTAVIQSGEQSLKLKLNSKTVYINGERKEMDTNPVMKANSVFIPLKSIIDTFRIRSEQQSMNGGGALIVLKDDRFLTQGPLQQIREMRITEQSATDKYYGIFPRFLKMEEAQYEVNMRIESRNTLGQKVEFSNIDLGMWLVLKNEIQKINPDITDNQTLEKGGFFTHNFTISNQSIGDIEYIFSFPKIKE